MKLQKSHNSAGRKSLNEAKGGIFPGSVMAEQIKKYLTSKLILLNKRDKEVRYWLASRDVLKKWNLNRNLEKWIKTLLNGPKMRTQATRFRVVNRTVWALSIGRYFDSWFLGIWPLPGFKKNGKEARTKFRGEPPPRGRQKKIVHGDT